MTPSRLAPLALSFLALSACDNKARSENIANVEKKAEKDADEEKRMEERKQKRLADEKAKADAAAQKRETIVKLAVVPAKLPKKLDVACDAVAAAQDRFVQRSQTGDALQQWANAKENELPMTVVQCASANSLEVAACQANALDNAPVELKDDVRDILSACVDKYAPPQKTGTVGAAQTAVVPKKPPR